MGSIRCTTAGFVAVPVSNSWSGGDPGLDQVPAVGDFVHEVQVGSGHFVSSAKVDRVWPRRRCSLNLIAQDPILSSASQHEEFRIIIGDVGEPAYRRSTEDERAPSQLAVAPSSIAYPSSASIALASRMSAVSNPSVNQK
jgi:hypothetical protein